MSAQTPQGDILVVDDNADNIRLLEGVLIEQGYRVRAALNGTTALSVVDASPPQLILLDICMPETDGFSVCERLKSKPTHRDIPVIFLSGLPDETVRARAFRSGASDYLIKPFDMDELLGRVRMHLDQRELSERHENQSPQTWLANEETSHLSAAASHDLRQPLIDMRLLAEALQVEASALSEAQQDPTTTRDTEKSEGSDTSGNTPHAKDHRYLSGPARIQHLSGSIAQSLDHLQGLVDNLLDWSALNSGAVEADCLWFPVRDFLEPIERDLLPLTHRRNLGWSCFGCESHVYSDPVLLERIVRKLLDNALRNTLRGRIGLRASRVGDSVELTISDTGAGMSTRQVRATGEGTFAFDSASTKRGLGLSIVRRLCDLLDHSVQINSQLGLGTSVTVTINETSPTPVAALVRPTAAPEFTPPENVEPQATNRVLLIDADSTLGDEAFALLIQWGYHVQRIGPAEYLIASRAIMEHVDLLVSVCVDANAPVLQSIPGRVGPVNATRPLILLGGQPGLNVTKTKQDNVLNLLEPLKPAQFRSAIRACLRSL